MTRTRGRPGEPAMSRQGGEGVIGVCEEDHAQGGCGGRRVAGRRGRGAPHGDGDGRLCFFNLPWQRVLTRTPLSLCPPGRYNGCACAVPVYEGKSNSAVSGGSRYIVRNRTPKERSSSSSMLKASAILPRARARRKGRVPRARRTHTAHTPARQSQYTETRDSRYLHGARAAESSGESIHE